MSLVPSWAPNLHPLIVHFPIALLVAAVAVDLAAVLEPRRQPVRNVATWLYVAGAIAAVAAYFTGHLAARTGAWPPDAATLVDAHRNWAFGATWLFAFFASLRLAMSYILRTGPALRLGAFAVALIGLGALVQTALEGTRLVFEQGLGVRPVAAARASAARIQGAPAEGAGAESAVRPEREDPQ